MGRSADAASIRKLWIHRYRMQSDVAPRDGVLIKAEWGLGAFGYSDLLPYPEFNEPELETHLGSLASRGFTPLCKRSLELNLVDCDYRVRRRNAFSGMILPGTHKLVTDARKLSGPQLRDWRDEGFSHIKVKMGDDLDLEGQALVHLAPASEIKWRLDMNSKPDVDEFVSWWAALGEVRAKIDFVEDPSGEGAIRWPGPWANDWDEQETSQIRIVKPAREGADEIGDYERVIFTHSMDHVLGQVAALWSASRYYADFPKQLEVCGLGFPEHYADDDFSKLWRCDGPRMKPPPGTGFGFDELLASLKWESI